jgi:hypothetical protein
MVFAKGTVLIHFGPFKIFKTSFYCTANQDHLLIIQALTLTVTKKHNCGGKFYSCTGSQGEKTTTWLLFRKKMAKTLTLE